MKRLRALLGWIALAASPLSVASPLPLADTTSTSGPAAPLPPPVGPKWWTSLGRDSLPYDSLQKITINLGFMPGSDANGPHPRRVANAVSLDLVSSETGAIRGVQGAGAMNDVEGSIKGIQASGGLNLVGGNMTGFQGSGVNLVHGNVKGLQYGSLFNRVGGDMQGVQIAVIGNITEGEVRGFQTASIVNKARSVRGVQDGFVNLSDRVRGGQGGFVNVADDIEGFQWGFVNIADTMVGPQIGLVNIRPDARYFVESWFDETGLGHLSLNYGSPGWYNLLDIGYRTGAKRVAFGLGFGGRLPSRRFILSLEGSASILMDPVRLEDASDDSLQVAIDAASDGAGELHLDGDPAALDAINGLFRLRATAGCHLWGRFALFAGVSGNALVAPRKGYGSMLVRPVGEYHWDATHHIRCWPGFFAGVRI